MGLSNSYELFLVGYCEDSVVFKLCKQIIFLRKLIGSMLRGRNSYILKEKVLLCTLFRGLKIICLIKPDFF